MWPYNLNPIANKWGRTRNWDDSLGIYQASHANGFGPTFDLEYVGGVIQQGLVGYITIGVNSSASYQPTEVHFPFLLFPFSPFPLSLYLDTDICFTSTGLVSRHQLGLVLLPSRLSKPSFTASSGAVSSCLLLFHLSQCSLSLFSLLSSIHSKHEGAMGHFVIDAAHFRRSSRECRGK
jgi:hypothetical protein